MILGRSQETGELITLSQEARSRGVYVVGSTGTGKTTLLQSIAYQDMKAGHGLCVLDPHGDMIQWLLTHVPEERVEDVILFDPTDDDYPMGLNLLACDRDNREEVRFVISTMITTLRRLFWYSWGPRLEHVLNHAVRTTLKVPNGTLIELLLLLTSNDFRGQVIGDERGQKKGKRGYTGLLDYDQDRLLVNFWYDWFLKLGSHNQTEVTASTINKLSPFLLDPMMRNIVGQTRNAFNMRRLMDERRILLVNLAKGKMGENNSSLLGTVLVNLLLIAGLRRGSMTAKERLANPFHLIVDEYQNFASESFSVLQSEARKYGIDVVVAHQFRDQLDRENRGAALNVGNFVSFRTTGVDGPELAMQFDNTPPEPEKMYVPVTMPAQERSLPGAVRPGGVGFMRPMPQRSYSDVMMQTANELSNLPPFVARLRLIGHDEGTGKPTLFESTIDTIHPDPDKDKNAAQVYGTEVSDHVGQIRNRSRQLAMTREQAEKDIAERTNQEILPDMGVPPAFGIVDGED